MEAQRSDLEGLLLTETNNMNASHKETCYMPSSIWKEEWFHEEKGKSHGKFSYKLKNTTQFYTTHCRQARTIHQHPDRDRENCNKAYFT
jgi:hypothetical protein